MPLSGIADILRQSIGLDPAILGWETLARAVRERLAINGMPDLESYAGHLRNSPDELQELVEEVVVAETWFFRDAEPFLYLARQAAELTLSSRASGVLRILSVPCSTGEEPYSIAMALLDAGLDHSEFEIDAMDISRRALDVARRAVYGRNSFRGSDLEFRGRHFQRTAEGYLLNEKAARKVRFLQGNLMDPALLSRAGMYHVIFCRNLLIYLDIDARRQALETVDRLLEKPGLLFVGHAETVSMWTERFTAVSQSRAFAYHTRSHPDLPARLPLATAPPKSVPPMPDLSGSTAADAGSGFQPEGSGGFADSQATSRADPLERARRLADAGNLDEAARLCESHLRECGPSSQGYYLLGLVRQAMGNDAEARELFGKAVYLEPDHYHSLIHLALLARQLDPVEYERWQQRARRASQMPRTG